MSQTTLYYIQVTMVTDMLRIQISKTGFNYVYVNNYIYKLYIYIYDYPNVEKLQSNYRLYKSEINSAVNYSDTNYNKTITLSCSNSRWNVTSKATHTSIVLVWQ